MSKKIPLISIIFGCSYFVVSLILTIPGMGIESILFINSVKKQLKIAMPKNKYVLDAKSSLYEPIMKAVVKNSFTADAMSTLNYGDQEKAELEDKYKQFSNEWFEKYWTPKIEVKENIDFYDIAMNMIEFDVAIASKYQSFGYVNTGIQWIFSKNGIKEVFSKDLKEKSRRQQGVVDQKEYDETIKATGPGLTGMKIIYSPGILLKNNKTWFVNSQIDSLKYAIEIKKMENPFINKNLTTNDLAKHITPDMLYQPNVIRGQIITQIAFIMLCSSLVITPTLVTYGTLKIIKNKKRKK